MKSKRVTLLSALLCLGLCACDAGGKGDVRVVVSGEGPAKSGYPFGSGEDEMALVDGWEIRYTKVLVSLSAFEMRTGNTSAATPSDGIVADLHLGDPLAWTLEGIEARRWDRVSYEFSVPTENARALEGVSADDVRSMRESKVSVLVEGSAIHGSEAITFSIGLPDRVRAYDCVNGVDGTAGKVVPVNGVAEAELTIHLDHFFYDSLASEEPSMRFEHLAALAGSDGHLTLSDLESTPVTDIRDRAGDPILVDGRALVLDPGPFALDANRSIASFVRAAARTLGHFGGEGHCRYVLVDP